MVQKLAWLALAGALGTLARYSLAGAFLRLTKMSFPWGTMVVNLMGCFLAGLLWALFEHRWPVSNETRVLVLVGFMGAFTTFSAFILDTSELFRSAAWSHAVANVAMQNLLGFAALLGGVALGQLGAIR